MKWFRFWVDAVNDVKLLQLSDYEYRMWTYLMAYASETDSVSGQLQITFKLLSLHFHQRFNLFSRAIETFQKVGLITVDEHGYVTIINWNKRQFKSDNAYERVKKHREVTSKRNVSVTAPDTDTDTDTDTEKDKSIIPSQKKRRDEYDADFLIFWSAYPKKAKKPNAYREWKKLGSRRPDIAVITAAISNHATWRPWIEGYIPDPERWLKNERWTDEKPPDGGNGNGSAPTYRTEGRDIREYRPEQMPVITEEERKRNLAKLRDFTKKIGT